MNIEATGIQDGRLRNTVEVNVMLYMAMVMIDFQIKPVKHMQYTVEARETQNPVLHQQDSQL